MIISIVAEKAFEKVQHTLMIKDLKKPGLDGTNLNLIKAKYDENAASIIAKGEMESVSHNSWNEIKPYSPHPYST